MIQDKEKVLLDTLPYTVHIMYIHYMFYATVTASFMLNTLCFAYTHIYIKHTVILSGINNNLSTMIKTIQVQFIALYY